MRFLSCAFAAGLFLAGLVSCDIAAFKDAKLYRSYHPAGTYSSTSYHLLVSMFSNSNDASGIAYTLDNLDNSTAYAFSFFKPYDSSGTAYVDTVVHTHAIWTPPVSQVQFRTFYVSQGEIVFGEVHTADLDSAAPKEKVHPTIQQVNAQVNTDYHEDGTYSSTTYYLDIAAVSDRVDDKPLPGAVGVRYWLNGSTVFDESFGKFDKGLWQFHVELFRHAIWDQPIDSVAYRLFAVVDGEQVWEQSGERKIDLVRKTAVDHKVDIHEVSNQLSLVHNADRTATTVRLNLVVETEPRVGFVYLEHYDIHAPEHKSEYEFGKFDYQTGRWTFDFVVDRYSEYSKAKTEFRYNLRSVQDAIQTGFLHKIIDLTYV